MSDWNTNLTGTGSNLAQWKKYTVSYSDLAAASLTNDIQLFSLPAKNIISGVVIKHSAAFTGGLIIAYTVSVGISGNLNKYGTAFNVFQAPGATTKQIELNLIDDVEHFTNATSIRVAATSVGSNLSAATAGSVDIWVRTEALP